LAPLAKPIRPAWLTNVAKGPRCASRAVFDVSGAEKCSGW